MFAAFQQQFSSTAAISRAASTHVGVGTLLPVVGIYSKPRFRHHNSPICVLVALEQFFFILICVSQVKPSRLFHQHISRAEFFFKGVLSELLLSIYCERIHFRKKEEKKHSRKIRALTPELSFNSGLTCCFLWSMILKVHLIILRSTLVTVLFLRVPSLLSSSLYFEHFFVHFHRDPRADVCHW